MGQSESIVEGGEKITTHWWVAAPVNQFIYQVFVVRQHEALEPKIDEHNSWADWQEYLDDRGSWHVVPDGAMCEPALVISQRLVLSMGTHGPFNRDTVASSLETLATTIFKRVATEAV